jgi:hypothetical protein
MAPDFLRQVCYNNHMKKIENRHTETSFAIFIGIIVVVSLIFCLVGIYLYQNNGTVNLDRSLPRYLTSEEE